MPLLVTLVDSPHTSSVSLQHVFAVSKQVLHCCQVTALYCQAQRQRLLGDHMTVRLPLICINKHSRLSAACILCSRDNHVIITTVM